MIPQQQPLGDESQDIDHQAQSLFERARSMFDQGDFNGSAEAFSRVAAISGYESAGHFGRGLSLLKLNDPISAGKEFVLVLEFDSEHSGAFYELGQIAEQDGNLDAAIGWYKKSELLSAQRSRFL